MAGEHIVTRMTRNGQVTLPAAIRREANVEEGDILTVHLEADRIVLIPKKLIDKSQAYFWTEDWQEAEREAERDLAEGRVEAYETVDELIAALEHDQN
ncbi:MAG: AbrB/MazE/SpoVT family DNA-binding domain-containing protein [Anaerolineales bacterium]